MSTILKHKPKVVPNIITEVDYGFRTGRGVIGTTFSSQEKAATWFSKQPADFQRGVTFVKITKTTTYEKV